MNNAPHQTRSQLPVAELAVCSQTALATSTDINAVTSMNLSSHALLRGQKTVAITHNGETYRLQATRLGKLILTK